MIQMTAGIGLMAILLILIAFAVGFVVGWKWFERKAAEAAAALAAGATA